MGSCEDGSNGERQLWPNRARASGDADVDRLRHVVANLEKAAAPFLDGPAGFLSRQTSDWLLEAKDVAGELRTLAKQPKSKILAPA